MSVSRTHCQSRQSPSGFVAFGMTEAVVDALEVVEVDEEKAELPSLALCACKHTRELVLEIETVR